MPSVGEPEAGMTAANAWPRRPEPGCPGLALVVFGQITEARGRVVTLTLFQRLTIIRLSCLFVSVGLFVASGFVDAIRWVLAGAGVVGILAYIALSVVTMTLRVLQIGEAARHPRPLDSTRHRAVALRFRVQGGTLLALGVTFVVAGVLIGDVIELVGVLAGSVTIFMGILLSAASIYFSRRGRRPPSPTVEVESGI